MKKNLILATVAASVLAGAWAHAAVLTLRTGQKVEGELVAATRDTLTLQVGTQSVAFSTAEVALIAFGDALPPAPAPAIPPEPSSPGRPAPAVAVVGMLGELVELARGEPKIEEYEARLAEAAGALRALSQGEGAVPGALSQGLTGTLEYLRLGAAARKARASKSGYVEISRSEYLDRCTATDAELQVVVKPGADDLVRGIGASVVGPRPFVACAAAELARAEAAMGR